MTTDHNILGSEKFQIQIDDTTLTGKMGATVHQMLSFYLEAKQARDKLHPLNTSSVKEVVVLNQEMQILRDESEKLDNKIKLSKDKNLAVKYQIQLDEKVAKMETLFHEINEKSQAYYSNEEQQALDQKRQEKWNEIATKSYEELLEQRDKILKYFLKEKGFKNIDEVLENSTPKQKTLIIDSIIINEENELQTDFFQLLSLTSQKALNQVS